MQESTRACVAAVETTVSDRTPPAAVEPLPLHPARGRQGRREFKSLLEREHYISPLQRSAIKNKAETTHSCIAVGEKGKAVWPGADWDVQWCWWLATHDGSALSRRRKRDSYTWPCATLHRGFLFHATLITPSSFLSASSRFSADTYFTLHEKRFKGENWFAPKRLKSVFVVIVNFDSWCLLTTLNL